jgi:hypothetical protein
MLDRTGHQNQQDEAIVKRNFYFLVAQRVSFVFVPKLWEITEFSSKGKR